jgi:hypothetical protein
MNTVEITCPHCGEGFEIPVDPAGGPEQEFVYDCEVCCRPMVVSVTVDPDGAVSATVRSES